MYVTLVTVATATPGPAVLFIMTHAAHHGWRKAVFAALGNITGLFCLGILAVTGLGTIVKTSQLVFDMIKYAGAGYLVYLGFRLLSQKNPDFPSIDHRLIAKNVSSHKLFFQAFGVAMSNPKAIVFLTALFPPFVAIDQALLPQFSMLIVTLMLFSFSFLMFYASLAHNAKIWLTKPQRMKAVNRTSGSVFIGFGVLLATSAI